VLCSGSGVVLGRVCEVFGPVSTPFYVMRWAKPAPVAAPAAPPPPAVAPPSTGGEVGPSPEAPKAPAAAPSFFATVIASAAPGSAVYASLSHRFVRAPLFPSFSSSSPLTASSIVSLRVVWGSVVITAASLSELLRAQGKGTDASNVYDEEVRAASRLHSFWIPLNSLIPSPLLTPPTSLALIFMGMPPLVTFSYFMWFPPPPHTCIGGRGRA